MEHMTHTGPQFIGRCNRHVRASKCIREFLDRKKNIIIRGGENIACLDVEGALHRHPAVQEAGVFAVPDERLGEVVGAGIQLRPDYTTDPEELSAFLADHIAAYKIPDHYWFQFEDLPRGATDKTDRRALRDQCLGK